MLVIKLDLAQDDDIENVHTQVNRIINQSGLYLSAMVNNAWILHLGEVEWGFFEYSFGSIIQVNTFSNVKIARRFIAKVSLRKSDQ